VSGDLLVTGASSGPSHLGQGSTPGTGFGVILVNLQASTIAACAALGKGMSEAYANAMLPAVSTGNLAFTSRTSRNGEQS
jgi:hypothetical protein